MCKLTRAERFKDARTVHNKNGHQSMDEVYAATGVSASMIKDLEDDEKNRSVGYDKIVKLSEHYGVSSDYLLGFTDDYRRSPCAVDELGLSSRSVNNILEYVVMSPSDETKIGLNMLLENKHFYEVAMELGHLSNWLARERKRIMDQITNEYEPAGKDEGFPPDVYAEIVNADLQENLLDELEENHPELEGHIELLIGSVAADVRIYRIMTKLDYLIRQISGYKDSIP